MRYRAELSPLGTWAGPVQVNHDSNGSAAVLLRGELTLAG